MASRHFSPQASTLIAKRLNSALNRPKNKRQTGKKHFLLLLCCPKFYYDDVKLWWNVSALFLLALRRALLIGPTPNPHPAQSVLLSVTFAQWRLVWLVAKLCRAGLQRWTFLNQHTHVSLLKNQEFPLLGPTHFTQNSAPTVMYVVFCRFLYAVFWRGRGRGS